MLLAQKPHLINFRHRRQPASLSALTVVPHPTNTPGLFAIAKPIRQQPRPLSRSQSPRCQPRGRPHRSQHQHQQRQHQTSLNIVHSSEPSEEMNSTRDATDYYSQSTSLVSPSKKSTVPSSEYARPISHPQEAPSGVPPLALSAQPTGRCPRPRRSRHKSTPAATAVQPVPVTPLKSSPTKRPTTPERPIPQKMQSFPRTPDARAPSPVEQCPPMPSTPIPVPDRRRGQSPPRRTPLSKSEPGKARLSIQTHSPTQPPKSTKKRRKNKIKRLQDGVILPLADWDFPVRESDDDGEAEDNEPPSPIGPIPHRTWLNDGPKTAPLQTSHRQFPFFTFPVRASPSPARTPVSQTANPFSLAPAAPITPPRQIRPEHRRAPSQPASLSHGAFIDGVFHLSEDEGDHSPSVADIQKKMAMLFGEKLPPGEAGLPSPVPPLFSNSTPSPRRKTGRERDSIDAGRQLFASSSFQIAPEPIELPTPSFISSRSKLDL